MKAACDFMPVLRAFVGYNYKQNEIILPDIESYSSPILKCNLLSLMSTTTIVIKRSPQGSFIAEIAEGNFSVTSEKAAPHPNVKLAPEVAMWKDADCADSWCEIVSSITLQASLRYLSAIFLLQRVFDATIAFDDPSAMHDTLKTIANNLINVGYGVTITTKVSSNSSSSYHRSPRPST